MKKTVITPKNGKMLLSMNSRIFHRVGEDGLDHAAILTELLKTHYKLSQKAVDSILAHGKIVKDGETSTDVATTQSVSDTLTALDKARIVSLKETAEKDSYQKGFSKAKGEVLTAHEEEIKDKYGVTSDLHGVELYDQILAEKLKLSGTSDDEVKKTAAYQREEARWKKELKEAKEAGDNRVKELETNYKKEGTFAKVGETGLTVLDSLNPIKATSATVESQRRKDFLNELKSGYDYEVHDDGNIVVMDKTGKVLDDGHGNTLSFEAHVKGIAPTRFEFAVNNDNENAGDKNNPKDKDKGKPAGAYPAGINKPKTIEELAALTGPGSKLKPEEKRVVVNEFQDRQTAK